MKGPANLSMMLFFTVSLQRQHTLKPAHSFYRVLLYLKFKNNLPSPVEVYFLMLVVAPLSIDRGTKDSVLGFLQSGETVF